MTTSIYTSSNHINCITGLDTFSCKSFITQKLADRANLLISSHQTCKLSVLGDSTVSFNNYTRFSLNIGGFVQLVSAYVIESDTIFGCDVLLGVDGLSLFKHLSISYHTGSPSVILGDKVLLQPQSYMINSSNVNGANFDTSNVDDDHFDSQSGMQRINKSQEIILEDSDFIVRFDNEKKHWVFRWKWCSAGEPDKFIGTGVSEYTKKMSKENRELFEKELESWVNSGYVEEYEKNKHGELRGLLPIMPVIQPHKSTPVRPVLDFTKFNTYIESKPGRNVKSCTDALRSWRKKHSQCVVLDIRKAYLQIRLEDDLKSYLGIKIDGKLYVVNRMVFGLACARKVLDKVVGYIIDNHLPKDACDNYVDDVFTDTDIVSVEEVVAVFNSFGLPFKEPSQLGDSNVLGLKTVKDGSVVNWSRGKSFPAVPDKLTKRSLFSWCGSLLGHLPIGGSLRTASSVLRRLVTPYKWDDVLPESIQQLVKRFDSHFRNNDPCKGVWSVANNGCWKLFTDASNLARGCVLMCNNHVVEDESHLKRPTDKSHINLSELEAVVDGLNLATRWKVTNLQLYVDSEVVKRWLSKCVNNEPVHSAGQSKILVERRLSIITDLLKEFSMKLSVNYIPSKENPADALTRIPSFFNLNDNNFCGITVTNENDDENPETQDLNEIKDWLVHERNHQLRKSNKFYRYRNQFVLKEDIVFRRLKVPPESIIDVPVVTSEEGNTLVHNTHLETGHASWQTLREMLRRKIFFLHMAESCNRYVSSCVKCLAANPIASDSMYPSTISCIPDRPWQTIFIDTLYISVGAFPAVLVMVDQFSKYTVCEPLISVDAQSIVNCLKTTFCYFGHPENIRCDLGKEFDNYQFRKMMTDLDITTYYGAVGHSQSQGLVERTNRTILTMIRKTIDEDTNWQNKLCTLVHAYNVRPNWFKISPFRLFFGREPKVFSLRVFANSDNVSESQLFDYVDELLSEQCGHIDNIQKSNPFSLNEEVLFKKRKRSNKCLPWYEEGWVVKEIVNNSTCKIQRKNGGHMKIINVDQLAHRHKSVDCQFSDNLIDDDDRSLLYDIELGSEPCNPHSSQAGDFATISFAPNFVNLHNKNVESANFDEIVSVDLVDRPERNTRPKRNRRPTRYYGSPILWDSIPSSSERGGVGE